MGAMTPAERFLAPEIIKVRFIPTIAAEDHHPTAAERAAGTLLKDIADYTGWSVSGNDIATPDIDTRFTKSIPGRTTSADSSITHYADLAGDDIRKVVAEGQSGYIEFADGGDEEGKLADIFPVRAKSVGKVRSTGDQAHQITIGFTITGKPATDVPIPAAGA